jgi:hypothetical protein
MSAASVSLGFAHLSAAGSARRLAAACQAQARTYPQHANAELSEAARHKDRARWYLVRARWDAGPTLPGRPQ